MLWMVPSGKKREARSERAKYRHIPLLCGQEGHKMNSFGTGEFWEIVVGPAGLVIGILHPP